MNGGSRDLWVEGAHLSLRERWGTRRELPADVYTLADAPPGRFANGLLRLLLRRFGRQILARRRLPLLHPLLLLCVSLLHLPGLLLVALFDLLPSCFIGILLR